MQDIKRWCDRQMYWWRRLWIYWSKNGCFERYYCRCRSLENWPEGSDGGALHAVTGCGRLSMYYGCWMEGNYVNVVFLLRGENDSRTWTRTSDVEVLPGRKFSENLDASYLKAMHNKEHILMEFLIVYAIMGRNRVKGPLSCAAQVSTPIHAIKEGKIASLWY